MQVFISYSRKDTEFVRELANDLTARGIDVWLDTEDLATADDDRWRRSIVQGIRESSVLIVVLSPNSVASEQVERELTIAAETKRRVIPIVESPCELPDGFQYELAGVQRIDFSELPREVAVEHLVRRIRGSGPQPPSATPSGESPLGLTAQPSVEHATTSASASAPPSAAVGAAAAATSVLPPTSAVPPFEASKPSTARPKPPGPTAMSAPAPSRPHRRLAAVLLGVGSAAVLAIVLLVVLGGGGGDDGGLAGSELSVQTTDATSEDQGASDEPSITVARGQSASPQAAPPASRGTDAPPSGPSEADVSEMAVALVDQLEQAYNSRDWDAVRRLNPNQSDWSDAAFEEGYGTVDGLPRLEVAHHWILARTVTGESTRQLIGTIIAYDLNADGEANTNVACITWDADVTAGTVAQGAFEGSDGRNARRLPDWLPDDQFESTAQQYCG